MVESNWRWDEETSDSFAHGIFKLRTGAGDVERRPDLEALASHLRETESVENVEFDDGTVFVWPSYLRAPARAALQHPLAESASQALEVGFEVPVTRGFPIFLGALVFMGAAPIVLAMLAAMLPVIPPGLVFIGAIFVISLPSAWLTWRYLIKARVDSWKDDLAETILTGVRSGAIEIELAEGEASSDDEQFEQSDAANPERSAAETAVPGLVADLPAVESVGPKGELVTHAAHGRYFATDAGSELRIWSSEGVECHQHQKMESEKPDYVRYGLGPEGRLLFEADEQTMRLVELEEGTVRWSLESTDRFVFWGSPVFSPEGGTLAAPMSRDGSRTPDVWVIDVQTAEFVGRVERGGEFPTLPEESGGMPRKIVYEPDGRRMAIEYGANAPGPTNHSTFLADTETLEIDGCLRPQPGRGVAVDFGHAEAIATVAGDGVLRVFEGRDALTGRPPHLAFGEAAESDAIARHLQAAAGVAADSSGTRVVAVSGGTLVRLDLDEREVVELDDVSGRRLEWIGLVDDESRAAYLTADGAVEVVELDPPGEPEGAFEWSILSIERSEAEEAIWEFAKQNFDAAIRRAEPCVTEVDHLYAVFVISFLLAERGTLEDLQVDPDRLSSGLVRLAEVLAGGGEFVSAVAAAKHWIDSPMREDRPEAERREFASLGVEIVRELRDRNAVQVADLFRRAFPDHYGLLEAFVMETKIGEPDRAMEAVDAFLDRNPESLRAWWRKLDLLERAEADNLSDVLDRTEARFSLETSDAWGQLGRRYANLGDRDKALDCYRNALELEPSSDYYRDRVSELQQTA